MGDSVGEAKESELVSYTFVSEGPNNGSPDPAPPL